MPCLAATARQAVSEIKVGMGAGTKGALVSGEREGALSLALTTEPSARLGLLASNVSLGSVAYFASTKSLVVRPSLLRLITNGVAIVKLNFVSISVCLHFGLSVLL